MKNSLLLSAAVSLFLFSCSVNQQIYLSPDGSGHVESSVLLEDFFITTLQDLTDLSNSGQGGGNRLDSGSIKAELEQNPFFTDIKVESPRDGKYSGSLSFHHIEELFLSTGKLTGVPAENRVLEYKALSQDTHQLKIRINKDNFQQLFQLFPMLQDPGFQYFLPEPSISEAEYKEMLFFIFEDARGIEEKTLRSLINSASLNLLITVEGRIIEQKGGQMFNTSTMKISLPLIKLLLHKEDINYSLTYKSR
ncbi:hypothetical protein [Oceanispirochaeta sp.]|jgi:hypothetical protein|uniref:hypothetical protein n=1 Tax=Oceanispirochaeta sp. TaxID=2035350 RepID=UPI00260DC262|nr:hypothetical protein [Oceanispirochaeta sp.]MDA3958347.1 hypothetical protein [Oceanispirochaeta sp.]